jgi:SAM-dependent methyltransferase
MLKNPQQWKPTKFVMTPSGLTAAKEDRHLSRGSYFIGGLQAGNYEKALRNHAHGRLLDLGCGHVPLYGVYRDLVSENICVDWENTMHVNPFLDITTDLDKELPFPDDSFDTVLLTDVLEHLPEPVFSMRQIARVLRPRGKAIIAVPFFYWLHEVPYDYYRYTEFALRRFCDLSRLEIVELWQYGGLPEILLDLTSKALYRMPRSVEIVLRLFHSAGIAISRFKMFNELGDRSKKAFPLGYILIAQKCA